MTDKDGNSVETDIALLKRDFDQLEPLYKKLLTALENVTEMATHIRQLVAVQEQKISTTDQTVLDLKAQYFELLKRVSSLENWKWWVVGIVVAIGILSGTLSHMIVTMGVPH